MQTNELKKIREQLCHIKLIEQAKEILENRLKGEKNFVTKDAYNVFVISAFLLVKENLIKKDCNNDILYFDYNNKEYISYILNLASKINRNNYIRNNTIVDIQNISDNIPHNLENAIWVVNKIRDSLAHAVYEIIDDKIVIDNDHTDEIVPYKLSCTLDIDDLAEFVLSVVTNTKIDKNDIFKYISPVFMKKEKGQNHVMVFNGRRSKVLLIDPKKEIRKLPFKHRIFILIEPKNDFYDIRTKNEKKLKKQLPNNRHLQKSLEYGLMKSFDLIDEAIEEETLTSKAISVINSLTDYFGTSNIDDIINYIYLYNYMALVFSLNAEEKINLQNLDLTNIDININDIDYNNLKTKISDIVENSTTKIEDKLNQYKNHKDVIPSSMVENTINSFYTKVSKKVDSLNRIVVKLLRNGIEHANIMEENNLIKISDKANQNSQTLKASFTGTVYDFLNITSFVYNQKINENVSKMDINLLENIVDEEKYNSIINTLNNARAEIASSKEKVKVKQ